MAIVNRKYNIVYIFWLYAMLFLMYPLTTVAQTDDNAVQNALLSFSIDETPVRVGDTFTLHLNAENVTDLAGWQCNIVFDLNVLEAVEVSEGDFLKAGGATPFFQSSTIDNTAGKITKLSAARFSGGVSGTGRLFSVTFMAKTTGDAQVTLTNLYAANSALEAIPVSPPEIVITVADQSDSDVADQSDSDVEDQSDSDVEDQSDSDVEGAKLSFSIDETPIRVGDTFTLHLNAENVTDLAGWQCNIVFDLNVLEAVEVVGGDFLKAGGATPFFQDSTIDNTAGEITKLSAARFSGGVSGTGRLFSVTFTAKASGDAQVTLTNLHAGSSDLTTIPLSIPDITITVADKPTPDVDSAKLSFSIDETPIRVGDTFTLHLNAENVTDLAGWQCDIVFDLNVLEAVEVSEGDFLKAGGATPFFQDSTIDNTAGKITNLSAARFSGGVSGTGRLFSVTFTAKASGDAQVTLTNLHAGSSDLTTIPLSIPDITITVADKPTPDVDSTKLSFSIDEIPVRARNTFTLHLNAENVTDFAGWLCDIVFDPAALEAVEVSEGDFLKADGGTTFFLESMIDNTTGKITGLGTARFSKGGVNGTGRLLSVTFTAKVSGDTQVKLTNLQAGSSDLVAIPLDPLEFIITINKPAFPPWDVNQDGEVNILDIMQVAQYLREDASVNPQSDVNSDGTIGILDLIAVAQQMGESTASAPTFITHRGIDMNLAVIDSPKLTPAMIRGWITHAQIENDGSIVFQKGIANLQRLLTSLTPEKTKLLANYPNPFNPETWIPYHLAKPAEVTLTIYAASGKIVRSLVLGHQEVGIYKSRSRAAYWDGRNEVGEPVASGIYFYTLTAEDFTATRKMLIRK